MTEQQQDLNQVIVSAVNARVEAAVIQAFSGDEIVGQYVAAALNEAIEVPDKHRSYGTVKTTFIKHAIASTVQAATHAAVKKFLSEETETIEKAVQAEIRRRAKDIAVKLVDSVKDAADSNYQVKIDLIYPGR